MVHHLDDGGDAAALLADHLREGVVIFDLGGGVRLVAELVLEPHDVEGVALAIRLDARHQEAAQALIRIGERQEGVGHGRRAEPFVAHEPVSAAGAARAQRKGARAVGAHVGAALLLGHGHAHRDAPLFRDGPQGRVVNAAYDLGLPHRRDIGLMPECRDARIGHADGAHGAGLGLRLQRHHGGVRDVGAGPLLRPADAVNAMLHGERHQPVIGRMKLHLVDAPAEAVEGLQFGRIAVRILAPLHRFFRARRGPQRQQRRLDPFAAENPRGVAQGRIRRVQVPARQGRRHVRHVMRFELGLRSVGCHERTFHLRHAEF